MSLRARSERWEPWLFWALVGIRLWPMLVMPCFPTLDGPCHLNNARILLDLLLGHETFSPYFQIDPFPEPNMLGHLALAALMTALPALLAEKALQLLTAIAFAW